VLWLRGFKYIVGTIVILAMEPFSSFLIRTFELDFSVAYRAETLIPRNASDRPVNFISGR
jgi:hypothetical protein